MFNPRLNTQYTLYNIFDKIVLKAKTDYLEVISLDWTGREGGVKNRINLL